MTDGPIAAIDCGTNTIKLLIGEMPDVAVRESRMVRLGEGVDRTGRLAPAALERTFGAIEEYAALVARHGVRRMRFCATSATRDASNAVEFADGVEARLGLRPEVVSGEEEAALSFTGARRGLTALTARAGSGAPLPGPLLVVDVGGGSTETVLGDVDADVPRAAYSMDIGSVRLHERHVAHDPPTAAEVAALVDDVERTLDTCPVPLSEASTFAAVSGTGLTVVAGVLGLASFDRGRLDGARVPVADVHAHVADLLAMSVAQRRELPWMHPGRADVIGAGAVILDRLLRRAGVAELTVSVADILDGIAWSIT